MTTELSDSPGEIDDGEPVDLVTIATFTDPTPAHVARLRLESQDIPCFIADENIGSTAWHYSMATGGVKLQVPRKQADAAMEALRTSDPMPAVEDDAEACPVCHGCNPRPNYSPRRAIALFFLALMAASLHPIVGLVTLVVGIWYLAARRERRCAACGEYYEPSARGFDVLSTETHQPKHPQSKD